MNNRTAQILKSAIESFINTGEPVSSGLLFREYDFGIKPAMIRIELEGLEENGYLTQPYHSAGRVPTDAGYEFFANTLLGEPEEAHQNFAKQNSGGQAGTFDRSLKNLFATHSWNQLLNEMASELGLLGVLTDFHSTYKEGIDDLISNLEWQSRGEVESVINDFGEIDKRLQSIRKKIEKTDEPEVFIGKKSPV